MRHYLKGMLLLAALGSTGLTYAADRFCDGPGGIDPGPGWEGGTCPMARSTLPGRYGVEPNFATLDLTPFYEKGSAKPFSFFYFPNELNLVGTAQGAKLDVLEFALRSVDPRTGDYTLHVLGMSVHRDTQYHGRTLLFTLRSDFFLAQGDRPGPSPTLIAATAELAPSVGSVLVSLEPTDGDWSRLRLVVENLSDTHVGPVGFDVGNSFALQPGSRYANVQPWYVSAGVIRGDLQDVGMTAAFDFELPRIEN